MGALEGGSFFFPVVSGWYTKKKMSMIDFWVLRQCIATKSGFGGGVFQV